MYNVDQIFSELDGAVTEIELVRDALMHADAEGNAPRIARLNKAISSVKLVKRQISYQRYQ
jgi:hypothetical protein